MVLPSLAKGFKLATFFTVFSLLICIQPAFSQQKINELDGIKSERFFANIGRGSEIATLATSPMTAPTYSIHKTAEGGLEVGMPDPDAIPTLYTEVMLAIISACEHNGISEGSIDEFMEYFMGGEEMELSRIGYVQKVDDAFYASFVRREPRVGEPIVLALRFKEVPAGKVISREEGAVIELSDYSRILVTIGGLQDAPREYSEPDREKVITVQEVRSLVMDGNERGALLSFFTSPAVQSYREDVVAALCNDLIALSARERQYRAGSVSFLDHLMSYSSDLIDDAGFSGAAQLMAGQAITIISWMDHVGNIPGAEKIRLTTDDTFMATSKKHGRSFIDARTLPEGITAVGDEGARGFFWRGVEKISKLGPNIDETLIYDREHFLSVKDRVIMYLMDHGFYKVDDQLSEATDSGNISTMHETFFMHDTLPGSFQATSTGPGHFQETKLDAKFVTQGHGIQFNVLFDAQGNILEVRGQELRPGDWTVALPGYVDYMVNLGGLRFNDVSINLTGEMADVAELFSPSVDFSKENIEALKAAIASNGKVAPYTGVLINGQGYVKANRPDAPPIIWMRPLSDLTDRRIPLNFLYDGLSSDQLKGFARGLHESYEKALSQGAPDDLDVKPFTEDALRDGMNIPASGFGLTEGLTRFTDLNTPFARKALTSPDDSDPDSVSLLRVSIEQLSSCGDEAVKFLSELSRDSAAKVSVEIFSATGDGVITDSTYADLGIVRKLLPAGFVPTKENTITLMPVLSDEAFTARGNQEGKWMIGDMQPKDTIISPVGLVNDKAGLVRGLLMGLRLNEIARQLRKGKADEAFVTETLNYYKDFCVSMGVSQVNLNEQDLVNMAGDNLNRMIYALNRIIRSMPILPLNPQEQRAVYEHAREALVRA